MSDPTKLDIPALRKLMDDHAKASDAMLDAEADPDAQADAILRWNTTRKAWLSAMEDAAPALLDLAERAEGLVFVCHAPSGVYRALAADAAFYELRPEYSGRGTVMERQEGYALVVPSERAWVSYPSLDSAIAAARAHDEARRGAK